MAIGRVNTGGGGSGGTLEVTAPVGVTVTATKSGKSYTRTANAQGKATFKGLASGVWSVTISDGTQTSAAVGVTVTADYAVTMAFFSATINVTYPAGSTCTCTKGGTTLTASGTGGSYTFTVPEAGEWTVSCTNGDKTASKSVTITAQGQIESVTLAYSLYLLQNGVELNGFGAKFGALAQSSKNTSTTGVIKYGGATTSGVATSQMIDISGFRTLYATVLQCNSAKENTIGVSVNPPASAGASNAISTMAGSRKYGSVSTETTFNLDISGINGNYYIVQCVTTGTNAITIKSIWLE